MSSPVASHSQNLYLGLPPNGSADYERDYNHNFRIIDFITQNKSNVVVIGLAVTAGAGLTVNWAVGWAAVNGTIYAIGASSGSATDNSVDTNIHLPNYIFVNNSGAVTISISLPTTEYTPLAIVFTNAGAISKVADCRKIASSFTVLNKTSNYTLTTSDCNGATLIHNQNASANVVYDAPAATAGLKTMCKCSTQISASTESIKVVANGIESFKVGTTTLSGYNTGTVAVTQASAVVTGTGTTWSGNVRKGDRLVVAGNSTKYYVLSVDSNTQITLTANYAEATASGQSYTISASLTSSVVGSTWELTCEVGGAWIASLKGVQPKVEFKKNADQTGIASAVKTKVLWQTKVVDNNNNFTNSTFSPTIPGTYIFKIMLNIVWGAYDGYRMFNILYKDGVWLDNGFFRTSIASAEEGYSVSYIDTAAADADYESYVDMYGGGSVKQQDEVGETKTVFKAVRISD